MRGRRLRVSVTDALGRARRGSTLGVWLAANAPARARGELAIALVPDPVMRRLNRTYRGQDYATDVLSFVGPGPSALGPGGRRSSSAERQAPTSVLRGPRAKGPGPTSVVRGPGAQGRGPRAEIFLGDIVIATGVCRRQAREHGHGERDEARILALHGLLHLLGYDHETDGGAMRRAEERLRRRAGLPLGVIARGSRRPMGR